MEIPGSQVLRFPVRSLVRGLNARFLAKNLLHAISTSPNPGPTWSIRQSPPGNSNPAACKEIQGVLLYLF